MARQQSKVDRIGFNFRLFRLGGPYGRSGCDNYPVSCINSPVNGVLLGYYFKAPEGLSLRKRDHFQMW
jgi:hypothetical protein